MNESGAVVKVEDVYARLDSLGYSVVPEDARTIEYLIDRIVNKIALNTNYATFPEQLLQMAIDMICGEFKSDFSMIAMHSQVATNLENLKLLQYAKGVDENGVIKDLGFATWNGKSVIIDDAMPYDKSLG